MLREQNEQPGIADALQSEAKADRAVKEAVELPTFRHWGTEDSGHTLEPEQSVDQREALPSEPGYCLIQCYVIQILNDVFQIFSILDILAQPTHRPRDRGVTDKSIFLQTPIA